MDRRRRHPAHAQALAPLRHPHAGHQLSRAQRSAKRPGARRAAAPRRGRGAGLRRRHTGDQRPRLPLGAGRRSTPASRSPAPWTLGVDGRRSSPACLRTPFTSGVSCPGGSRSVKRRSRRSRTSMRRSSFTRRRTGCGKTLEDAARGASRTAGRCGPRADQGARGGRAGHHRGAGCALRRSSRREASASF